ncbi:hypothetical protein BS17DRAFT_530450 [Gyrodon lividus]|nr:hypothetical protein BS17DRAFT_530450 [Gyrodon lividus]
MYFTIPACVVEYARILSDDLLPVASQSFVDSLVVIDLTGDSDKESKTDSDVEIVD